MRPVHHPQPRRCTKCQAPNCPTDTANCTTCGANLSTEVALDISVDIEGYTVNVKGNVQYAARVNFTNIIAKVFADTSVTGDQPAFEYWTATTDASSTRDASISGSLTASGDFAGSVSVSASFECAVGVNFRGGKPANQSAGSCRACTRSANAIDVCDPLDAGVFDAGSGSDAGGPLDAFGSGAGT